MNRHPWANRHRRKGFTADAAVAADALGATHNNPAAQNPRGRTYRLPAVPVLRAIGMRVSYTNRQAASLLESRRPTGSNPVANWEVGSLNPRSSLGSLAGHCMRNLSVTKFCCWSDLI